MGPFLCVFYLLEIFTLVPSVTLNLFELCVSVKVMRSKGDFQKLLNHHNTSNNNNNSNSSNNASTSHTRIKGVYSVRIDNYYEKQ
jgi:hypothetical protein